MSLRILGHASAAVVGALVIASCVLSPALAQSVEKPKVSVGAAGSSGQIAFLALNVLKTKGFTKEFGVDFDITDFGSGAKGVEALVTGTVELLGGVYEHAIRMQAKGQDIKTVVCTFNAPGLVLGVTKAFAPSYKSITDLKGKTVAISAPGSASDNFLKLLLSRAGMKADDVSVVGVGNAMGAVAAIRNRGEIQAIVNYDPVIAELESAGDIKVVTDARGIEDTRAVFGSDYTSVCLLAHGDFVKKNPNTTQAIVNGMVKALKWMSKAAPDEILEAVPKQYWENNKALYREMIVKGMPGLSRDGLVEKNAAETVYKSMAQFDPAVQAAKVDLAKTYDNSFVEKALREVKN
jgi:NitT/TauT family transport system substrate-binding protein